MLLCHSDFYQKMFTKSKSIVYCCLSWSLAFISTLPYLFIKNDFECEKLAYVMNKNISRSSFLLMPTLVLLVIYAVLLFNYQEKLEIFLNNRYFKLAKSFIFSKELFITILIAIVAVFQLEKINDEFYRLPLNYHLNSIK